MKKTFQKHQNIQCSFEDINTVTLDLGEGKTGRGYVVGNPMFSRTYPSVTTVMGIRNEDSIDKWRAKVGAEEADRVSKRATTKGTAVHKLIEDFLDNREVECNNFLVKDSFVSLKPILESRVDNIVAQEAALYSNKLRMAGRVDCIAEFDGVLSIIDFKTSGKQKEESWIQNYFIQETSYAMMFEEMFGIAIDQIVTLIAVEHDSPQVVVKTKNDYISELKKTRKLFYERYGK